MWKFFTQFHRDQRFCKWSQKLNFIINSPHEIKMLLVSVSPPINGLTEMACEVDVKLLVPLNHHVILVDSSILCYYLKLKIGFQKISPPTHNLCFLLLYPWSTFEKILKWPPRLNNHQNTGSMKLETLFALIEPKVMHTAHGGRCGG